MHVHTFTHTCIPCNADEIEMAHVPIAMVKCNTSTLIPGHWIMYPVAIMGIAYNAYTSLLLSAHFVYRTAATMLIHIVHRFLSFFRPLLPSIRQVALYIYFPYERNMQFIAEAQNTNGRWRASDSIYNCDVYPVCVCVCVNMWDLVCTITILLSNTIRTILVLYIFAY